MILRLILTVLIAAFSGIGFAQAPEISVKPLQQSSTSVPKQMPEPETRVFYEKYSSTCMIFAVDRSWFHVTMYLLSTLDLNRCDEKRFAAMTNDSARAQLLLLYPSAEFRLHGPYFQLADLDVTSASHSYVDVGKLKFSLIGEAKFNILDLLKDVSVYQQVRNGNYTYLPFRTVGTVNLLWFEGSTLYELIAPNGMHYTMMAGSHILRNDKFGINLNNLGSFLNLPKGWRFEKRTSDKIFRVFRTELGGREQTTVIDELGNLYIYNEHFKSENISK
ncbi:MAG: hypothetical protein WCG12_06015 [Alcaligenaceae bacterium]